LPHTDKRSSIARKNIASTCSECHAQIEQVHERIIAGELWKMDRHLLPACVDSHQPHKGRKSFYEERLSRKECLSSHKKENIKACSD